MLRIEEIQDGAVIEKINRVIQKVLNNIVDPNTKADAKRELVMTMTFKPNEERAIGALEISVLPKLAGDKSIKTALILNEKEGQGYASEMNSGQYKMDLPEYQEESFQKIRAIGGNA